MAAACANCKFYEARVVHGQPLDYGWCKRYPPSPSAPQFPPPKVVMIGAGFPLVHGNWWCGEYEQAL